MNSENVKKEISDFLDAMTMPYDSIEVIQNEGYQTFMIHSSEARHLIGTRGESFEALRHLLYKVIQAKTSSEKRPLFTLDVNNYYTKKLQSLLDSVSIAAKRARLFKQDVELPPMSAHERMIVHAMFASDPDLTTGSVGTGKFRHIVLSGKGENQNTFFSTAD